MSWVCSLQIGDFEVYATSMGKFAGFCLDDPEVAQAIQSRDHRILDALIECLSQWDELCAIQWSKDGLFWDTGYNCKGPADHLEWWERNLRLIIDGELAEEWQRTKAREALIELLIKRGTGVSIPSENIKVDCTQLNLLLAQYDCDLPDFYVSSRYLPKKASGVYLLWRENELDYIGRSINVRGRLDGEHKVYHKDEHLIGLISIPEKRKQKVVEIALIGALHPAQNNQWSLA